ncbi:HAD-IA family hydrolase [Candidatus Woesearchaeota archaeon]|nr:HAD-IA family hydrolase [Candidatus Woesearchaeota archaeon]
MKLAKDVMKSDFRTIKEKQVLTKALADLSGISETVVILDDNNNYLGMMNQRSIIRKRSLHKDPSKSKVRGIIMSAPKINKETSIPECARLMISSNIPDLPITEDQKVIGVIDDDDILKSINDYDFSKEKIEKYMTKNPITAEPDSKISAVINTLKKNDISRLPIVSDKALIGLVTIHDIAKKALKKVESPNFGYVMDEKNPRYNHPVENIMTKQLVTVKKENSVQKTVDSMLTHSINSVLVINEHNRLSGIATRKDIMELVAQKAKGLIPPNININSKIDNLNKKLIGDKITEFSEKSPHLFKRAVYNIYIDEHRETFRDKRKLHVKLRVHTPAGRYIASSEGWDENNIIRDALEKIYRQAEKRLSLKDKSRKKTFGTLQVPAKKKDLSQKMLHGITKKQATEMGVNKLNKEIDVVIFDMDGTLIDSIPLHKKTYEEIFEEMDIPFTLDKFEEINGRDIRKSFEYIKENYGGEFDVSKAYEKKKKANIEISENADLFPQTKEILEKLKKSGYRLILATSATQKEAQNVIKRFELGGIFECATTADDIKKSKPHPSVFEECIDALNLDNKKSLVIEDSPRGIEAAKRAGMKVAAVATTHNKEQLREADYILDSIKEIEKLLV